MYHTEVMKTNSTKEVIIMANGIEQKEHITLTDDGVEHQVTLKYMHNKSCPLQSNH